MGMFDKFKMDFDQYKADVAEINEQQQNKQNKQVEFKDPVDGDYNCDILSLELGTTKDGSKLMLKGSFKIQDGEFKNSRLWVNKVLTGTKNDAWAVSSAVKWLNTLGGTMTVEFNGDFDDLASQIEIVFADVRNCTFVLAQKTSDSGFKNYFVNDVFDN